MHLEPPFLCCFRGLLGHAVGVGGCDGGGGLAPTIWKLTLRLCQLWRQLSRWHARDCCRSDRPCFISFHLPVLPVLSEISGKPRSVNNESPLPKQKLELNRFGDGIRLFNTLEQPFSIRKPHKARGSSATPVSREGIIKITHIWLVVLLRCSSHVGLIFLHRNGGDDWKQRGVHTFCGRAFVERLWKGFETTAPSSSGPRGWWSWWWRCGLLLWFRSSPGTTGLGS